MSRPKPLVPVAEDDEELRLPLVQSLEFRGYEVIGVLNGADVLQKIRVTLRRPDLIPFRGARFASGDR